MSKFVLDAYAWVEYLEGSKAGLKVREIILDKSNTIYTNSVTVAEVISRTKRKNMDIKIALNAIGSLSIIINIDFSLANEVGLLHADIRKTIKDFGLADAFVLLTARKLNAKILTGDPHFKGFKETIII